MGNCVTRYFNIFCPQQRETSLPHSKSTIIFSANGSIVDFSTIQTSVVELSPKELGASVERVEAVSEKSSSAGEPVTKAVEILNLM